MKTNDNYYVVHNLYIILRSSALVSAPTKCLAESLIMHDFSLSLMVCIISRNSISGQPFSTKLVASCAEGSGVLIRSEPSHNRSEGSYNI